MPNVYREVMAMFDISLLPNMLGEPDNQRLRRTYTSNVRG
jgi:hypothetical protein